jgi:YidC/Oxa1 family membrane protein insertase
MKDRLEFQKKLAYLRQRYKNDPEALQREQAELLKTQGFAGMGGCLPMLMQIPFFFGLSRLLSGSIELYQAPMGWIPNLAARDPYYILPIIVCVALLIQASSGDSSMDAKQRLTSFAMAFFLGAVTVNLSAGLALYMCVNTVLSVLQTNLVRYFRR